MSIVSMNIILSLLIVTSWNLLNRQSAMLWQFQYQAMFRFKRYYLWGKIAFAIGVVAVHCQHGSSPLLVWQQSTAGKQAVHCQHGVNSRLIQSVSFHSNIHSSVCCSIHTAASACTYGCVGLYIRLHRLTLTAAYSQVPLQLRNYLLQQAKVPVYTCQIPLWRQKATIKKCPFHRSFTPIEGVFSIVSFTPSRSVQAADCQSDVVKPASFTPASQHFHPPPYRDVACRVSGPLISQHPSE